MTVVPSLVALPAAAACCSRLAAAPCCLLPCCAAAWLHFSSAANVSTQASKSLHPTIRPVGSSVRQSGVHTGALETAKTALHCHMLAALCRLQRHRASGTRWRMTIRHVSDNCGVGFGEAELCQNYSDRRAWTRVPECFDLDCIAPTCALQVRGVLRCADRTPASVPGCRQGCTAGVRRMNGRVLTRPCYSARTRVSRLTDPTTCRLGAHRLSMLLPPVRCIRMPCSTCRSSACVRLWLSRGQHDLLFA